MRSRFRLTICSLLVGALALPAFGQENTAPESVQQDTDSAIERLIYVPYRKLRDVFQNQDASAVLPYKEYLRLLEAMMQPKSGARIDAVITESAYTAEVAGDLARIAVRMQVLVTGDPWVRVPVTFGDAAIGRVTADRGQVLLQGTGDGKYALLFSEAGEHTVTMELVSRVRTSPEGRSLALTIPRVGITTFELKIPKADQTVTLTPTQITEQIPAEGELTHIRANIGSTAGIVAAWTPRASARPQMDLLTSVSNALQVRIDEGLLHRSATMTFNVLRGEMSELTFVIPASDRLLDVTSAGNQIRRYSTTKEANRQVVKVELLAATEKNVVLEVHTEQTLPEEDIPLGGIANDGTVHGIHALNVVRESGQLSVTSSDDLSLNVIRQDRVTRTAQSGNSVSWRFYGSDMDVAVAAETIEPRIIAQQIARYSITEDNQLRLTSRFTYQIERAGIFEVRIRVPGGLNVENVVGPAVADFNVADGILTVTLSDKKTGAINVDVVARRDFAEANTAATPLPFLAAEGAFRESGNVLIDAPPAVEVITEEGSVTGLFPADHLFPQQTGQTGTQRLLSAWSYNRQPVAMSVSLRRKPARMTALVTTQVNVQPRVTTVETELRYVVENAGVDTFRVDVPEEFADAIRITSPSPIKQQTRSAEATDGWVTWSVVLQKKIQGQAILNVSYDVTPPDDAGDADAADADDSESAETTTLQPLRAASAGENADIAPVQVQGEVAIRKDQSLAVSAEAEGEDIETIDVRELSAAAPEASIAYRYFRQDGRISITATRYPVHPVVETVVARAGVEVVLGRDSTATYLCRYVIRSSERQRLRIDLPADAEVLDQLVNGTRISLTPTDPQAGSNEWDSFFANVGTAISGGAADQAFLLTLHFRAGVPNADPDPFEGYRGSQRLVLPRIGGASSGVVVQQLRTVIWVPRDFALIGHPEQFVRENESVFDNAWPLRLTRPDGAAQLESWLNHPAAGVTDFPREGHSYVYASLGSPEDITVRWWNMPFSVWVISGAVFLIGFVLRKTPWENKLTVLLVTAFASVLYGLEDLETVMQSLYAGVYGLIAVAILWVLYAVGRSKPPAAQPPDSPSQNGSNEPPAPPSPQPPPPAPAVVPPPGAIDAAKKMAQGGQSDE